MNKKVIGVIIIVLILLGAGIFLATKKSPVKNSNSASVPTQSTNPTVTLTQGSLKSLLMAGKSEVCTFSNSVSSVQVSGTVYVANGKIRGDFKSSGPGNAVTGHMIVDSQYSYVWTDQSTQGIKMALNSATQNPNPNAKSSSPDLNQSYQYTCQPFTATGSTFTIPTNITFQTITIPSGAPTGAAANPQTTGNMCAACDNIPAGPSRDSCKTQLHCQ